MSQLISLYDPKADALGLARCARKGLKGAMIWCSPPTEQPYSSSVSDMFWAAAEAMNMPISLHSITGMGRESQWTLAIATCARRCFRTRSSARLAC